MKVQCKFCGTTYNTKKKNGKERTNIKCMWCGHIIRIKKKMFPTKMSGSERKKVRGAIPNLLRFIKKHTNDEIRCTFVRFNDTTELSVKKAENFS